MTLPIKKTFGRLDFLLRSGWRSRSGDLISLVSAPSSIAGEKELFEKIDTRATVSFELPAKSVLVKEARLPKKARSQADKILRLRKEALEGETNQRLVATTQGPIREGNEDRYIQYLVKQTDIQAVGAACSKVGTELDDIWVSTAGGAIRIHKNDTSLDRATRRWWLAALSGAVVLMGALLYTEVAKARTLETTMSELRARTDQLQAELGEVAADLDTKQDETLRLETLVEAVARQQTATSSLAAVTRILPASAWLTEFVWIGSQIRLSGTSAIDPISIIETFENESWVTSVRLLQPVRTDRQTQRSSFDLELSVVWGQIH